MYFIFIIICLLIAKALGKPFSKMQEKDNATAEKYPLKYPTGTVINEYEDILQEIEKCTDKKSINAVYLRIMIFHGSFAESESLVSELLMAFYKKDILVNS